MRQLKLLRTLRNYLCYCGIEKSEYAALKKDMYVSNFKVWRILHYLMTATFAFLFVYSLFSGLLTQNRLLYMLTLFYSAAVTCLFFNLKKDSVLAQLLIYLTISVLFLFSAFVTQNKPEYPATSFMVMLIITPMFMLDKPYFMGIELCAASTVFLIWMHGVKADEVWQADFVNIVVFSATGFIIHIISNSIRINEFVLTRKINIQKDTDELTGLKNKGAMTRAINAFLREGSKNKGIMFLLDVDKFKEINDTYGHDAGDLVLTKLGSFLSGYFVNDEIVGRFGGDEFIFFIKNTEDPEIAESTARDVISGVSECVSLPDSAEKIGVSIGIAIYRGDEKNYSEIFKKADMALYKAKSKSADKYMIYN